MIKGTLLERNNEYEFSQNDLFDYIEENYDNVERYGLLEDINKKNCLSMEEELTFLFE